MNRMVFLLTVMIVTGAFGCARMPGLDVPIENQVGSCAACHGERGISPDLSMPSLAGQRVQYTEKELRAYRDRQRIDPAMNAVAATLTDGQIDALAAYYADLPPMQSKGDPRMIDRGRVHYTFCLGCHGGSGVGKEGIPRLAGQHAPYLLAQLRAFRDGRRSSPVMRGIAEALSDTDMKALAEYMASLK